MAKNDVWSVFLIGDKVVHAGRPDLGVLTVKDVDRSIWLGFPLYVLEDRTGRERISAGPASLSYAILDQLGKEAAE